MIVTIWIVCGQVLNNKSLFCFGKVSPYRNYMEKNLAVATFGNSSITEGNNPA